MAIQPGTPALTIDNTSPLVQVVSNIANALTDIVRIVVPPRIVYRLHAGEVLKLKLFNSAGTEVPRSARLVIGVRKPNTLQVEELWRSTYGPWRALSETEQSRRENQGSLGINFAGPWLDVLERQQLVIQIESSVVVDWNHAGTFFETRVEEIALQG